MSAPGFPEAVLFDHDYCFRAALWRVSEGHGKLADAPWEELRSVYARLLEEIHVRLLSGELTLQEARHERFRRLFSELGEEAGAATVEDAVEGYGRAYR